MAMVTLQFTFSRCGNKETVCEEFDTDCHSEFDFDDFATEWCKEANADLEDEDDDSDDSDEWELDDWSYCEWDEDYGDPNAWSDWDEYVTFCNNVDEFGEAFRLRYEDVGEITRIEFQDSFWGEFNSLEEWAQSYYEDCYEIPDHLANYIDWEAVASDLSMEFSVYEGGRGVFIFRD